MKYSILRSNLKHFILFADITEEVVEQVRFIIDFKIIYIFYFNYGYKIY